MRPPELGQTLLLSVDFEDWHQLVRRRLGVDDWERAGPALERQTEVLLDLFGELGVRATFFVLGMAARTHPELVRRIAEQGHEIACHGDSHEPVHTQTPRQFARDLRHARETIEDLTGVTLAGYRAPAFSITHESTWAYEVLVEQGFAYDSSQHDSPRLRHRVRNGSAQPHPMQINGETLWEFPIAVWHSAAGPVPVGGPSYWSVMPTALILRALTQVGSLAGLYLHPQEVEPEHLDTELPEQAATVQRMHGALRSAQRNLARFRTVDLLRMIAGRHPLIPYGQAHASLVAEVAQ